MRIYVENLHTAIDDEKLHQLFSSYGEVQSAQVVKDSFTGAHRGFAYVEMPDEATKAAIAALDQTMLNDMKLTVREAPPVVERKGSYKVGNGSVNIHRFKKN